ncbi:putative 3-hydroxyacyl-CoA dehydrogenase [Apiospora phragmitis]|uniref:3-hydroxyacyl-CoA dehydrogenase n=1 Tax=Apiospora phragmitis TaxID=2905665 RepID=A0ABR1UGG7_9PEZI
MKIEGRTFVISGGASGLGQATAEELVRAGGYVAVLDMNEDNGAAVVSKLGADKARFFQCNVTDTESIAAAVRGMVAWVQETGKPLGGVIPAAGISLPSTMLDRHNHPLSLPDFNFVLAVNLTGTIDLVRQLLPHLASNSPIAPAGSPEEGERGIIIMVASAAAFEGQRGQVSYAASKGAVAAMTLPMTRDLSRYGIRVVTLAPSLFESAMTSLMSDKVRKSLEGAMEFPPPRRPAEEFAMAVRHAIENVMLNGAVIRLDGGMRMPSKL